MWRKLLDYFLWLLFHSSLKTKTGGRPLVCWFVTLTGVWVSYKAGSTTVILSHLSCLKFKCNRPFFNLQIVQTTFQRNSSWTYVLPPAGGRENWFCIAWCLQAFKWSLPAALGATLLLCSPCPQSATWDVACSFPCFAPHCNLMH